MWTAIQIIVILVFPGIFLYFLKGTKIAKVLSPVVMCYVTGIAIATFKIFPVDDELAMNISKGSVLVAIPLLLFSSNIIAWFRHAGSTVLSFFLAIVSALISVFIFSSLFSSYLEGIADYGAMLTGVYTGGTANLNAVGLGIGTSPERIVGINTVEMLVGGMYLLFLTSVAPQVFAKFLPKYKETDGDQLATNTQWSWKYWPQTTIAFFISLGIAAISISFGLFVLKDLEKYGAVLILVLTTLSVLASLNKKIRELNGSFELGDYFIMMFCIAVGMMSDLGEIMGKSLYLMLYTAATWIFTIIIHLVLSYFAKIDRDTTIITSTAALYGPPFIGQIASILNNRKIVFAGIATGLFGYAIGNYLGLSMHYLLERLFE